MTDSKFYNLQGFVWKTMQAWLDGKNCFSKVNCFRVYLKLQRAYCETRASLQVWKIGVDMLKFHLLYKSDIYVLDEFCYKWIHCWGNFILSILYLFPLYRTLKNNNKNYYITNKRKKRIMSNLKTKKR